jgi:hypothetical protein
MRFIETEIRWPDTKTKKNWAERRTLWPTVAGAQLIPFIHPRS